MLESVYIGNDSCHNRWLARFPQGESNCKHCTYCQLEWLDFWRQSWFLRTIGDPTCIAEQTNWPAKPLLRFLAGWPVLYSAMHVQYKTLTPCFTRLQLQDSQGECTSHAHFWDRRTEKCLHTEAVSIELCCDGMSISTLSRTQTHTPL